LITPESQRIRDDIRSGVYCPNTKDRAAWERAVAQVYALEEAAQKNCNGPTCEWSHEGSPFNG
jgi:hypothetical protein